MFPVWFYLFSVYLYSPLTASIIFDSLLEYLNGAAILTWYQRYTHLFPMWFDLFSVIRHSPFTAIIILDSLLEYLNGTTILTWYQSHLNQASCLSLPIEH